MDLFESISNSAARQIARRHLDTDAIADEDADAILSHLAGDGREHDVVTIIEADFEEGVGLLIDNRALGRNEILCCQLNSP
jgi:hypothetical protein